MAKDKKSVLLYCDLIHTVEKMDNETAGLFFKHYLRYVNDLNPQTDNLIVDLTFESVKQNLKRDLKKWEERAEKSRVNGSLGGRPKKEPKKPTGLLENQTGLKKPVKDTVTVNDTVNVIDINNNANTPKSKIDFGLLIDYFNKCTGKKTRVMPKKAKRQIEDRLKDGYTKNEIAKAILNASNSKHHKEANYKHLTLELISRSEKFDMFLTMEDVKPTLDKNKLYNDQLG